MTARAAGWVALAATSALASAILLAWHVPAAVLLGCMLPAIAFAVQGQRLAVPRRFFAWGQGLLGCLIAVSLHPRHLGGILPRWPLFLVATALLVIASTLLGWWLMRRKVLPASTALWGLSPGAASIMVVMSEQYGADMRLVAFMQYTRVVLVTLLAVLATRWALGPLPDAAASPWWGAASLEGLALTGVLVFGGCAIARRVSLAGGSMVLPLAGAVLAQLALDWEPALPRALMALAYAAIGWSIGLRFDRDIILHALRALPQVLLAIGLLVLVGLALAFGLVAVTDIGFLSAYLATSPGGMDSMAVIAATSAVDTGFVMAMQLVRFLVVLVIGPSLTRRVASAEAAAHRP